MELSRMSPVEIVLLIDSPMYVALVYPMNYQISIQIETLQLKL